jgi:hypothetical protein
MDEIDLAQERDFLATQNSMRMRKAEGPAATGRCLYCDEILDDTRRWCDAEHREQWQKETRRVQR